MADGFDSRQEADWLRPPESPRIVPSRFESPHGQLAFVSSAAENLRSHEEGARAGERVLRSLDRAGRDGNHGDRSREARIFWSVRTAFERLQAGELMRFLMLRPFSGSLLDAQHRAGME